MERQKSGDLDKKPHQFTPPFKTSSVKPGSMITLAAGLTVRLRTNTFDRIITLPEGI
jgi:hypothetical protein